MPRWEPFALLLSPNSYHDTAEPSSVWHRVYNCCLSFEQDTFNTDRIIRARVLDI